MISVIIPIYNSEQYLKTCLSSVRNQSFKDFEVLMIDDGSTDHSAEICKEFALADDRFHYHYKENGGSGSARNCGLTKAVGDYVAFLDSDDFIENDYLEKLSAPLTERQYDLIQSGMILNNSDKTTELSLADGDFTDVAYIEAVLKRAFHIFLFITTTSKLYRKELILSNGIAFDEDVTVSEDCLFNTQLLPYLHDVRQLHYQGYHYVQDHSTLTKTKSSYKKVEQSIKIGNITSGIRYSLIKQYKLENNPDVIKGFHTAVCIIYLSNAHEIECGGFTKEEKKKLYDSYFSVMDYPVDKTIDDYTGTDKRIIQYSCQKRNDKITDVYKLRDNKTKLKRILHLH